MADVYLPAENWNGSCVQRKNKKEERRMDGHTNVTIKA